MRILVLGGTQFIGRHMVEALLDGGHDVAILTRGRSADPLPDRVERLRGDRDDGQAGLDALGDRAWDACVDVSGYWPRQVRASVRRLAEAAGRYVFVSTIAVHPSDTPGPIDESSPCVAPIDGGDDRELTMDNYGGLKVRCEELVREGFGARATILRPQVVVGAHDPYDRYACWVRRAAKPGPMLGPGDGTDHVQVVDVVDLAAFVRRCVEHDVGGTFAMAGPRMTWRDFLALLDATDVAWVPHATLRAEGLTQRELPLAREDGGDWSGLSHVDNAASRAAGFVASDPATTLDRIRTWMTTMPAEEVPPLPLDPDREAAILARGRAE